MNFGFNSNVRVGDSVYHVQTEDRGPSHPFLDTVVYLAGRVIYKRSTSYEKLPGPSNAQALAQLLHERLSQQHRAVIAELEAGTIPSPEKLSGTANPPVAAKTQDAESEDNLDLRLLNPKGWFADGNVTLEIELSASGAGQRIADADVEACLELTKKRIPCAESRTDVKGRATLQFPMPADVAEGSSLVVRATDGTRYGLLRFRLKSKAVDKTPAPVA